MSGIMPDAGGNGPGEKLSYPSIGEIPAVSLRGDRMSGDRYYCKDFARREWDHMWTKVWHVGNIFDKKYYGQKSYFVPAYATASMGAPQEYGVDFKVKW